MDQLEVECVEDIVGQLVIMKKDSTDGGTMPLLGSSWTIGSDESCDLRIKNSEVRALHVKINLEDEVGGNNEILSGNFY
jgi:hypothetical protein